jgi:tetratricopeptide (TPR) repeat protein
MNSELTMPTKISFKSNRVIVNGEVVLTAVFARFMIAEVQTDLNDKYYLVFYKNALIYGEQLEKVQKGSFIDKVLNEGIILDEKHTLLPVLIPSTALAIPAKNKLFNHLQRQYSPLEITCIAAALDSFFSSEQLTKLIDNIFFHYRRNGSFFKAFQSIHNLSDLSSSLENLNERLHSREYSSYSSFYLTSSLSAIQKKDPLYAEFHCFTNRKNTEHFQMMEKILNNEGRYAEGLLVWMDDKRNITAESVKRQTELALKYIPLENWILALSYAEINPYIWVPESRTFIEGLMKGGQYEKAAVYLFPFLKELPAEFHQILNELWKHVDAEFVSSHLEEFLLLHQQVSQENDPKQIEQRMLQLVTKLMEGHDLKTVCEKLKPIQIKFPHSIIIRKINGMAALMENPDRMMELGQFYADLNQYDQAIDCFFWEMELNPADPAPVRELCKMYQHKGMVNEASVYQQIYTQLRSDQEIG